MSRKVIDLTLEITSNMPAQDAFPGNIYVQLVSHEESRKTESGGPVYLYMELYWHGGTYRDACGCIFPYES